MVTKVAWASLVCTSGETLKENHNILNIQRPPEDPFLNKCNVES